MIRYELKQLYNNTSIIHIDKNKRFVIKEVIGDNSDELIKREIYWLDKLKNCIFVPKLINVKGNKIKLSYCGEILTNDNAPKDLYKQLYDINISLLKNHCYYNDWKIGNVLVNKGQVYLIDYGWCPEIKEDYTCDNNIETIRKFKKSGNYFMNIL